MRRCSYLNSVLTVIAVLLCLLVVGQLTTGRSDSGGVVSSPAYAAPPSGGGLISGGEQRRMMITELRKLNQRVASLEKKLTAGVRVKVTEMPPVRVLGNEQ
jgi:hypothetical protein